MESQQDTEQRFPFLRLPLEVRHAIYNVLLCDPPPPSIRLAELDDLEPLPEKMVFLRHLQTSILRVNRQVYSEAREAMLRGNQFVRIRSRGRMFELVEAVCRARQIPVLHVNFSWLPKSARRPNYEALCVMTHHIVWGNSVVGESEKWEYEDEDTTGAHGVMITDTPTNVIILRRDLGHFCEALAVEGILRRKGFDTRSRHSLELHNPFSDTASPDFMGEANQERLLTPYCTYLQGFSHVRVRGDVSAQVARSVEASIATPAAVPDQETVLAEFRHAKDVGNAFFRDRQFRKAAEAYTSGCRQALLLKSRMGIWNKIKGEPGTGFREALAMIYYQVCLNRVQNMLAWQREVPVLDTYQFRAKAEALSEKAEFATNRFHSNWAPTLAQMAKRNFRMACVERLLDQMESAKRYVDIARQQSPSDPVIRREAEEIEALLRAKAGYGRMLL